MARARAPRVLRASAEPWALRPRPGTTVLEGRPDGFEAFQSNRNRCRAGQKARGRADAPKTALMPGGGEGQVRGFLGGSFFDII